MEYHVGDIVKLKKPHPCGSSEWEILRVGMDFRLKCMGCGHQISTALSRRSSSMHASAPTARSRTFSTPTRAPHSMRSPRRRAS
ncbi:MAG: DUF951 domain-containing protein, partial [Lachnospiraceae bacterium]|nr:DUF951 domain-containing protein [Lachnospiraceae bacterium]